MNVQSTDYLIIKVMDGVRVTEECFVQVYCTSAETARCASYKKHTNVLAVKQTARGHSD